jgi:hypothetical protein
MMTSTNDASTFDDVPLLQEVLEVTYFSKTK